MDSNKTNSDGVSGIPLGPAYKVLAKSLGVSNSRAKGMIDRGVVSAFGRRVKIARSLLPLDTSFKIKTSSYKTQVLYEDDDFLAIDKKVGLNSSFYERVFRGCTLINRLDRDTSGVMLLGKRPSFIDEAIVQFRKGMVDKSYYALVSGVISEEAEIKDPICTIKGRRSFSFVGRGGKSAISLIKPVVVLGKLTLLQVRTLTGRTHQIRVHLSSLKRPIVGDVLYGGVDAERLMLHSYSISFFGKKITSSMDFCSDFGIAKKHALSLSLSNDSI